MIADTKMLLTEAEKKFVSKFHNSNELEDYQHAISSNSVCFVNDKINL